MTDIDFKTEYKCPKQRKNKKNKSWYVNNIIDLTLMQGGKNYCDSPLKLFRAERTGEAFSNAAIVQKDALQPIARTLFQLQK